MKLRIRVTLPDDLSEYSLGALGLWIDDITQQIHDKLPRLLYQRREEPPDANDDYYEVLAVMDVNGNTIGHMGIDDSDDDEQD